MAMEPGLVGGFQRETILGSVSRWIDEVFMLLEIRQKRVEIPAFVAEQSPGLVVRDLATAIHLVVDAA